MNCDTFLWHDTFRIEKAKEKKFFGKLQHQSCTFPLPISRQRNSSSTSYHRHHHHHLHARNSNIETAAAEAERVNEPQ